MSKSFQLRAALLGLGFASLVAVSACAKAPPAPEASVVPAADEFTPDPAVDASEYDELFDDELFDDEFEFGGETASNDPFERTNRALLDFNQGLSRLVFDPMIRGYRFVMPEPGRRAVRRVFLNFQAPSTLVNDLLQLRFVDAATTFGRFVLNTTLGFAGLLDVAVEADWQYHESDFGQTLGRFGVGAGPYLVLPLFGPSTVRDGIGGVVDLFFQPLTYMIGFTPNILIGAGSGFTSLDAHDPALKALEESSVDFYAALRSAFLQNRAAHILQYKE
jgi:phospholipid-binding lipoprotein MlaA